MSRPDGLFWLVLAAGAVADQLSKWAALVFIPAGGSVAVLPWFSFTLVRNRGISFGLFSDGTLAVPVIAASIVVLAVLIRYGKREEGCLPMRVAAGMIAGGITGNLIDRIVRGAVVDFLDFRVWPVFNIADSLIVIGVCLMLVLMLKARHASGMHPHR